MKKTITVDTLIAAYNEAYKDGQTYAMELLEKILGKQIFMTIKSFEDARQRLGEDHPCVKAYLRFYGDDPRTLAFLQLHIITTALNEGWTPQFIGSEMRYNPYFWLFTQQAFDSMSEQYKQTHKFLPVKCGNYVYFSCIDTTLGRTDTISSSFYFKSEELACYCANQFIELWADLFGIQHD